MTLEDRTADDRTGRDMELPAAASPDRSHPIAGGLHDALRDAARFVISPGGHADDDRLRAAFKLLRARAPVYRVDTPGIRPFWLISSHAGVTAVERKGAPFAAGERSFLASEVAEDRLRRIVGTPYVLRGLLQMDEPDHAAYRAVAQSWFTPGGLSALEPWLADWAVRIVTRMAGRADPFDFAAEIAVPFSRVRDTT